MGNTATVLARRLAPVVIPALAGWLAIATPAPAASLQVAPVLVEVAAPGAAAALSLTNSGARRLNVQVRVFRWSQKNGHDRLEPTRDVIASPPFARLRPGAKNTIRVVRVSKKPVAGEESYRLLIDEIPQPVGPRRTAIRFALRYSIPVFFSSDIAAPARLEWTVAKAGGGTVVTASNPGTRRVRISALNLKGRGGQRLSFAKGLVGYVLGHSKASWTTRKVLSRAHRGDPIIITAQSENGPVRGRAKVRMAR